MDYQHVKLQKCVIAGSSCTVRLLGKQQCPRQQVIVPEKVMLQEPAAHRTVKSSLLLSLSYQHTRSNGLRNKIIKGKCYLIQNQHTNKQILTVLILKFASILAGFEVCD